MNSCPYAKHKEGQGEARKPVSNSAHQYEQTGIFHPSDQPATSAAHEIAASGKIALFKPEDIHDF